MGQEHASGSPVVGEVVDGRLHLLDRQVLDSDGRMVCKVDDLELRRGEGGEWYIYAIMTGPAALGPRIGGLLGRLVLAAHRHLRLRDQEGPGRVPWELVDYVDSAVRLLVRREALDVAALEDLAREAVVDKIPGAFHEAE